MEKNKENSKVEATGDQPIHSKEENNLHSKIVNSISTVNTVKDKSSCDMDIEPVEEKLCNKKFVEPVQDSIKKRRKSRRVIPCSHSSPNNSNSEENDENFARTRKVVINKSKESECKEEVVKKKEYVASLALSKITHDVKVDQNVVVHTERVVPEVPEAMMPLLESPETKRRRIERENMVVARQCRLHPANKKYNKGPVVNPPLISPGKMVGYTPAGQRHEVDLNFERPKWFNSEYARMQFDDATRINVSRMFHDLQTGHFLPDTLDANVERRYLAEQQLVTNEVTEHFKHLSPESQSNPPRSTADEEHLSLLESEEQLIQLNEFAVVKLQDFPAELASRLKNALMLKLTPLMFKKNPIIVETIEKLSSQKDYYEVAVQARALLAKIKDLFDVPKFLRFREYFAAEVERLMVKTKDMNTYDLMMMTDEPSDKCSIGKGTQKSNLPDDFGPAQSNSEEGITELGAVDNDPISDNDNSVIAGDARIVGPVSEPGGDGPATPPLVNIFSQLQTNWITVEDGEVWEDTSNNETYDSFSTREDFDEDSDLSETESELTDDDSGAWTTSYASDESDDDVFMEVTNLINGMVIIHGLPGFLVYDIFEYI